MIEETQDARRGSRKPAGTRPVGWRTGARWPAIAAAGMALTLPLLVGVARADTAGTMTITRDTRLRGNHHGSVVIAADNVTLDCAGFTIAGPPTLPEQSVSGVFVQQRSAVTVRNCRVTGFGHGIEVVDSTDVSIIGNHAFDNTSETPGDGLLVIRGKDTRLKNNVSSGNVQGIEILESDGTLLEHNRIEGSVWAGLIVSDSTGIVARWNTAIDNGGGLELYSSTGCVLRSNGVTTTRDAPGISLHGSAGNTVFANRVLGNLAGGISVVEESSHNDILRNVACRNANFDAFDDGTGTGNLWSQNRFCQPLF